MSRRTGIVALTLLLAPLAARAQQLDGPAHPFQDSLINELLGVWTMTGTVHGRPVSYRAEAAWKLGHQFLRLDLRDTAQSPAYEATVYIGYDNTSERYVAHWLDTFGGRFSETLGFGTRDGSSVTFTFEYPDGPFRTTFAHPAAGWTILMRQRGQGGAWEDFGKFELRRS